MPAAKSLAGQTFGRLTVIERYGSRKGRVNWLCRCECGKLHEAVSHALTSGHTKSCGCWKEERNTSTAPTHGHATEGQQVGRRGGCAEGTVVKIRLPRVKTTKRVGLGELFKVLLNIHKDIYLDERDIEVEFYDEWDFVKVSVFKWCDSGPGCGDSDSRKAWWKQQIEAITDLFDIQYTGATWRWLSHMSPLYGNKPYDLERENYIPGVCFWIRKELAWTKN